MVSGTGYAIFRDGICPRREDPALKNGGSFAHFHENIHKKSQMEFAVDTVDQFWHRLLKVTLVSAPPEILNEVQGVVVYAISKSNRRASLTDADISARRFHVRGEKEKAPAFKMEIWIKNAENAELFESCVLNRFGVRFFFTPNYQTKRRRS
jgi:hypothetical protein